MKSMMKSKTEEGGCKILVGLSPSFFTNPVSYMPFMCFLVFFVLIGTYKFWALFRHVYLLPLPTLFLNTVNLKTLGFWGQTKECLWSNSSVDAQSMTYIYVAARSQLVDAVFILKFLSSFYESLPATTCTCLVT